MDDLLETPLLINHLVIDTIVDPQFTGVLDADGHPIFRWPNPIGFGRNEEWY